MKMSFDRCAQNCPKKAISLKKGDEKYQEEASKNVLGCYMKSNRTCYMIAQFTQPCVQSSLLL